jgi:hypothetical protein
VRDAGCTGVYCVLAGVGVVRQFPIGNCQVKLTLAIGRLHRQRDTLASPDPALKVVW